LRRNGLQQLQNFSRIGQTDQRRSESAHFYSRSRSGRSFVQSFDTIENFDPLEAFFSGSFSSVPIRYNRLQHMSFVAQNPLYLRIRGIRRGFDLATIMEQHC
jgi:hypothetical protein